MKMLFSVSMGLAVLLAWSSESAFGQRGGGGLGIQKPHYGSSGGSRSGGGGAYRSYSRPAPQYYAQPTPRTYAQPAPQSYVQPAPLAYNEPQGYRSFSFEPTAIQPGDTVVVNRNQVRLMRGQTVVGSAPVGLTFQATKVINGWVGAVVEINGREVHGWIWNGDVRLVEGNQPAPPPGE